MLRYEPFRLRSVRERNYDEGRAPEFLPPELYKHCARLYRRVNNRVIFTSYSGMLGPLGPLVFHDLLTRLGLIPKRFPRGRFLPFDGNQKYWA